MCVSVCVVCLCVCVYAAVGGGGLGGGGEGRGGTYLVGVAALFLFTSLATEHPQLDTCTRRMDVTPVDAS